MKRRKIKNKLLTTLLTLCMLLLLMPISTFAAEPTVIDKVYLAYEEPHYNTGDTFKTWASITGSDAHYTIYDEYFKEYEREQGNVITPTGREWHSNQIVMSRLDPDKQITTVEADKSYLYYIVFQPEVTENSYYKFTEDTKVYMYNTELGAIKDLALFELVDSDFRLQYSYGVEVCSPGSSEAQTITSATVENAKFDYQPGDAPKATAWVSDVDTDKYEIVYECWQQFENNEPVAAWYSDNGAHGSLPTISKFESGKKYVYSLMLKPKEGYSFSSETVVTVNGEKVSVPFVEGSLYIPSVKTVTIRTVSVIDVVEINGATVSFKDGDKPVFTGKTPDGAHYMFRCEWWELDSNTGLISTEPEWGGEIYKNKINAFNAGKTYHYGVFVSAEGDVGNVRYVFGPDTKLKINGKFVNYKRSEDDIPDFSDGTTTSMWVLTDLTMIPSEASAQYEIIEGANGSWTQNTDGTLTVRANGAFSKFTGVKVDGALIDAKNYSAKSGSTIITLKPEYLQTLSTGSHNLTVVYVDGECSTKFEVKAVVKPADVTTTETVVNVPGQSKPADQTTPKNPKTGDESNPLVWLLLGLASVSAAGVMIYKKNR